MEAVWNWMRCRQAIVGVVLLAIVGANAAADSWVSVGPDGRPVLTEGVTEAAPRLVVERSDWGQLVVSMKSAGFALEREKSKGGEFVRVRWAGAAAGIGAVGEPALPVVRRVFVAPHGADVILTSHIGEAVAIDLGEVGYALPVFPVQASVEKIPGALEAAAFDFDEAAYGADADLPSERIVISEAGISRGQRLVQIEFRPLAYNPVSQRLVYYPDMTASIEFAGGTPGPVDVNPLPGTRKTVLNPELLPAPKRGQGNYLIVAANSYSSGIASFASAKSAQGFDVTTHTVADGTANTTIKSYIEGLWGGAGSPDYILLVGDTDTIPHWVGSGTSTPSTDLYYGCMDAGDDWFPDIPVGRFSVRSAAHLQNIIDKTLYYENGPLADPDYLKRAVFMASEDNYAVSEGTHNYVIQTHMVANEIVCDKLYCHTYNATTQQVRDSFNGGRFFGIYSGHGGTYSWADGPAFSQSDVNGLTNANLYPFVCSFSCITGTYTVDECFVETWIRAANKGALTMYGSSVNSLWTEDDILERSLFDAIYDAEDDVSSEVGPVWIETLDRYRAHFGVSAEHTRRYHEMYNLMGDPSLRFPGACSDAGTVTLNSSEYTCESVVTITAVDCGLNTDDNTIEYVTVDIDSDSETGVEQVTLTETDAASAEFEGWAVLSETDSAGVLLVAENDTVTVTYIDADDGMGGTNGVVQAVATVDCTPPEIQNVQATELEPRSAVIEITADEPVRGTAHYGESCAVLDGVATGSGYQLNATVGLSGLDDDTTYFYTVDAVDEAGNFSTDDNGGACYSFTTPEVPDYFTELFASDNDLDNISLTFIPDGGNDFYFSCAEEITALPTSPSGGTTLTFTNDDDGYATVTLSDGKQVLLYGVAYSQLFPGTNGYITFVHGESGREETLEAHFGIPRISALYDDLDPGDGGSVTWKQLADRAVVTWQNVPEYNTTNSNTFQIEMYFDGTIVISYLSVAVSDGLAGLSEGQGLDPDFYETDLSDMGFCGPRPPRAQNKQVSTPEDTAKTFTLPATDDGLPEVPGQLTYIVTSLPTDGTLYDAGTTGVEIVGVPYTLVANGNQVQYVPDPDFADRDTFEFKADDGGVPPDGGESDPAIVTIVVGGSSWEPVANDVEAAAAMSIAVDVTLSATDPNGDPLTYFINSLPATGQLRDPIADVDINAVPYELVGGGKVVSFVPPYGENMQASFEFYAEDATSASNVATATVTVGVARPVRMFLVDDEDPGWSPEGDWAFGEPSGTVGQYGSDPGSGYTGSNVYGYNLDGDYPNDLSPTMYLTTTPIDCSGITGAELRFRRWLGVEGFFDEASFEVSTNGADWQPIWTHSGTVNESAWSAQVIDLSTKADGASAVYLRWGMGPTDASGTYQGWNIDDLEIWGLVSMPPGDYTGDRTLDHEDCAAFAECMGGPDTAPDPAAPVTVERCTGVFDLDVDMDVDLNDFRLFQELFGDS